MPSQASMIKNCAHHRIRVNIFLKLKFVEDFFQKVYNNVCIAFGHDKTVDN